MKTTKRRILPLLLALLMLAALCGCTDANDYSAKPVIYLYPEEETEVTVLLDYDGTLTTTYPAYGSGWQVTAQPDGTLTDAQGREYSYLFWEGINDSGTEYDFSQGFCVRGENTAAFLQQVLAEMGLLPEEYNEFIVYWLPQMEGSEWNLISFQGAAYTDHARLTVTPEPDSVLRVFMAWKPVDEEVELPAQQFDAFQREGFTLVEWGGCRVQE
ncbi:MAG: hypothetical protein LUH09_00195 [Clostridiales bacterium]|nr:hypothetical protein [Clostridiales bacterium]